MRDFVLGLRRPLRTTEEPIRAVSEGVGEQVVGAERIVKLLQQEHAGVSLKRRQRIVRVEGIQEQVVDAVAPRRESYPDCGGSTGTVRDRSADVALRFRTGFKIEELARRRGGRREAEFRWGLRSTGSILTWRPWF